MMQSKKIKFFISNFCISILFFTASSSWAQEIELLKTSEVDGVFAESESSSWPQENELYNTSEIVESDLWMDPFPSSDLDMNSDALPFSNEPLLYSVVELDYAVGKTLGVDRNYGTLGFFAGSCFGNGWLPFIDIKEHSINDGKWGTNVGLGIRFQSPCSCRYLGGNLFYDYRQSCFKGFHQVGVGLESLGSCWDFRINAYVPIGNKDHPGPITVFDKYNGNFVVNSQLHTFALTGFDAEAGSTIWQCDCFKVYLAAGPYYYSKDKFEKAWGGKCRLNFQCNEYLDFELKVSHDSIYDTRVQSVLRIEVPFDLFFCKLRPSCSDNSCRNNQNLGPVQRNDLIILDNKRCWTKNY